MPLSPLLVAAGRLTGVAVACGFNLYATVAFLGLASRLDWFVLPPGVRGLENPVVIASAAALYLAETIIDKFPYVDAVWEAIHTLIRPLAVGLLVALALAGLLPAPQVAAAAGVLALFTLAAHGAKAGLRVAARTPSRPVLRFLISVLEDAVAVAIALAVLLNSTAAVLVAASAGILLLVAGPGFWRAGLLGLRAFTARLRGFFGEARWRATPELPAVLRPLVDPDPQGVHPPRATRAAVYGLRTAGAYRSGWLVIERDAPVFVFRALFSSRRIELPRASSAKIRRGLMFDVLELEAGEPYAVFLLKDGPAPEAALAELVV